MIPSTFCFTKNNHFLSIEHKGHKAKLYLVLVTKGSIIGLSMDESLLKNAVGTLANTKFVDENVVMTNSKLYDFIDDAYWSKVKNTYIFDKLILEADKDNFRIQLSELTAFDYIITEDVHSTMPLHEQLFISTHSSDLKVDKPQTKMLYQRAAKDVKNNIKPLRKKMYVIQNQANNFDATYTAVRNWLLEQNLVIK